MKHAKTLTLHLTVILALLLISTVARAQDSDLDGMPDSYETAFGCLMPYVPDGDVDYDSDGLTSLAEYTYSPLLNPCNADTDGDGVNDGREVTLGSDPLGAISYPGLFGKVDSEVQVTTSTYEDIVPVLAWTGSEYGFMWSQESGFSLINYYLYFNRLSPLGVKAMTDVDVPFQTYAIKDRTPSVLIWNGSEFAVTTHAWGLTGLDHLHPYRNFFRLNLNGAVLSSSFFELDPTASSFALAWTGSEYVTLGESMRRFSPSGALVTTVSSAWRSLAWTGSEFGGLGLSGDTLFFQRFSDTGTAVGSALNLSPSQYLTVDQILMGEGIGVYKYKRLNAAIVFSGSEFGVAAGDTYGTLVFDRISATGVKIGSSLLVSNSGGIPNLSWTGSEYALGYSGYCGTNAGVCFTIISPSGQKRSETLVSSNAVLSQQAWTGSEFGMVWQDYRNGNSDIYFARIGYLDPDGDGLTSSDETTLGTNPGYWDTDGDQMGDGWENIYSCMDPLVADSPTADFDLDGLTNRDEYLLGGSPCVADSDGDGTDDLLDCGPIDPNNWTSCATCKDQDFDGRYAGCDAYITVTGPDCDDNNFNAWDTCATCKDSDADGWYGVCNTYRYIKSSDCNDADPNNWTSCATCVDNDTDTRFTGCNAYLTIGRDYCDNKINAWSSSSVCSTCKDNDGDSYYGVCDQYLGITGGDCLDTNNRTWDTCATCLDSDADTWWAGCNQYPDGKGPDCAPDDPNHWNDCGSCFDADGDLRGVNCSLGADCNDVNPHTWNTCATCIDADGDSWYGACNDYTGINGPDCDDANTYAWTTCATCIDADTDSWYGLCDRYIVGSGGTATIGTGTGTTNLPISTSYQYNRTELIYLASEIGRAGTITALALDVTAIPGQVMNNFTIRVKHTSLASHSTLSWEGPASGWTTVYQANESPGVVGWHTFTFSTPFVYNGTSNLMVDISFSNPSTSATGYTRYSSGGTNRSIYYRTNTNLGDPLSWTGSTNPTPTGWTYISNLRVTFQSSINGPDCAPTDPAHWDDCGNCIDADNDQRGDNCNLGADCNDLNLNAWNTCATCVDADADGWYKACNAYAGINGPDCSDTNARTWNTCAACNDNDVDTWWTGCNQYPDGNGPDCNDANNRTWDTCATCLDSDADTWWAGCNQYPDASGPDCSPTDPAHWNDCGICVDADSDLRGDGCNLGADCNDLNLNAWNTCATCVDAPDGDGWYAECNTYIGINGPDCDNNNAHAWNTCATCVDADADNWYGTCNTYTGISGPDCSDTNPHAWDTCATCADADADGWYLLCNDYTGINGPDCSDTNPFAWDTCATCVDADLDSWYGLCNRYATGGSGSITIGTETSSTDLPISTSYQYNRTELIYLASEIGRPGVIGALALDVTTVPGAVMNNFTIRLKHTSLGSHSTLTWEGPDSGWTTVYQANEAPGAVDWHTFTFSTPFVYDGASNLMVDISFSNPITAATGNTRYSSSSSDRSIFYRTNTDLGDPLAWAATSPTPAAWSYTLNLRLSFRDSINGPDCDDADITIYPGAPEICDGLDNQCPGDPGYGAVDEGVQTAFYLDSDSDTYGSLSGSTLACTVPAGYATNSADCNDSAPLVHPGAAEICNIIDDNCVDGIDEGCPVSSWDTDLDGIPDTYEIAHNSGPMPLDYLNGADGLLDADTDGNLNVHEYWNGTDYRVKDPKGGEGCFFWGDATGDGFIGAVDITILTQRIKGPADYSRVIPNNGETQDLDDNGFWGAIDTTLLTAFAKSDSTEGIATRPSSIEKLSAATASVQVGNTTHVTVALRNLGSTNTVGFGVVFSIDPTSTGTAVILGGDGANPSGYRYDMTGAAADSGRSNVVILVKTSGTIKINAGIPQCGMIVDRGRYCSALSMAEPFIITGY